MLYMLRSCVCVYCYYTLKFWWKLNLLLRLGTCVCISLFSESKPVGVRSAQWTQKYWTNLLYAPHPDAPPQEMTSTQAVRTIRWRRKRRRENTAAKRLQEAARRPGSVSGRPREPKATSICQRDGELYPQRSSPSHQ